MITYDIGSLRETEIRVSRASFAESSVQITTQIRPGQDVQEWHYLDVIRVVHNGVVLIEGPCSEPRYLTRGDAEYVSVTVYDYWWLLSNTTYLGKAPKTIVLDAGRPYERDNHYANRLMARQAIAPQGQSVSAALREVLAAAREVDVLPCDYAVRVQASRMIPFVTSSASYASVLRSVQEWIPNSVSYFDYSAVNEAIASGDVISMEAARPLLVIADPASLPTLDLDYACGMLGDISLQARPDLVPPVVAMIGTDTDSLYGSVLVNSVLPRGASLHRPCSHIVQLDAGSVPTMSPPPDPDAPEDPTAPGKGYKYTNEPRMVIRGAAIPTEGAACQRFWERHVPEFKGIGLVFGSQSSKAAMATGDEGKGYSAEATRYELVEGQIGNKTPGIKWCKTIVRQAIAYPGKGCPADKASFFPFVRSGGQRWGWHTVELITTNVRSHRYRVGGDYEAEEYDPDEEEEEDTPPPPGVIAPGKITRYDDAVASLYAATRAVPYDGSIILLQLRPDITVGTQLNIVGHHRSEYATMRAITQRVDLDIMSGRTTVSVGPPKHLSLDKAAASQSAMSEQMASTKEETTPDPQGNPTHSWGWEYEPKQTKPESPGVGPGSKYIPPAAPPPLEGDFVVRALRSEDGQVSGYQVHSGKFVGVSTGREQVCGPAGWSECGSSEVWANLKVDKGGVPVEAFFSDRREGGNNWYPIFGDNGNIDMDRTQPAHYCFRVASMADGIITQHITGPIPIGYSSYTFAM